MSSALTISVGMLVAGLSVWQAAPANPPDLTPVIDRLGSFDFPTRTQAAHDLRRTPASTAVPVLEAAARGDHDEYARYRALVLLSDFGDTVVSPVMTDLVGDRDDRIRTVVYQWFERHPDPAVLPKLLAALASEQSEFVRPALTRALAAYGTDPRVRAALTPLVLRGEDLFRGSLIAALGDYDGRYALDEIASVATLDGPLQDDAVTALGKIGDRSAQSVLAAVRKSAPPEEQPTIAASWCLLGFDCAAEMTYLKQTLTFAASTDGNRPLLSGATHALGVLAARGHDDALDALIQAGVPAGDEAREPIALAIGLVALRRPDALLKAVEGASNPVPIVNLVRDAFDMLSTEDFEEEQFYVAIRAAYWNAAAGSANRRGAQALIDGLEF